MANGTLVVDGEFLLLLWAIHVVVSLVYIILYMEGNNMNSNLMILVQ